MPNSLGFLVYPEKSFLSYRTHEVPFFDKFYDKLWEYDYIIVWCEKTKD